MTLVDLGLAQLLISMKIFEATGTGPIAVKVRAARVVREERMSARDSHARKSSKLMTS